MEAVEFSPSKFGSVRGEFIRDLFSSLFTCFPRIYSFPLLFCWLLCRAWLCFVQHPQIHPSALRDTESWNGDTYGSIKFPMQMNSFQEFHHQMGFVRPQLTAWENAQSCWVKAKMWNFLFLDISVYSVEYSCIGTESIAHMWWTAANVFMANAFSKFLCLQTVERQRNG